MGKTDKEIVSMLLSNVKTDLDIIGKLYLKVNTTLEDIKYYNENQDDKEV